MYEDPTLEGNKNAFSTNADDVNELPDSLEQELGTDDNEKLGTDWDQRGMARIGKKQELRRQFQFVSITGYSVILGCSWEFAMMYVCMIPSEERELSW